METLRDAIALMERRKSTKTKTKTEMEMYNETLRHNPHSGHEQPPLEIISSATQTGGPHPSPIVHNLTVFLLSSLHDGLEVLDPLQSCNRRANHRRDAFSRLENPEIHKCVL